MSSIVAQSGSIGGMRATTELLRTFLLIAGCALSTVAVALPGAQSSSNGRPSEPGRMLRPRLLIHVVADIDKTLAFYRDGVGFTVASPPAPLTSSTLLHKVKAVH